MPLSETDTVNLQAGLDALKYKNPSINRRWQYYEGNQGPVWLNEALAKMFKGLGDQFSLNLCRLAVNAPLNRLWIESWEKDEYDQAWRDLRLDREQKRIYKHAMVAGESFVIGWRDDSGQMQAAFNDARTTHLFFEVDRPHVKEFAVKVWQDDKETVRGVIYYPDRIVRVVGDLTLAKKRDELERKTPGDSALALMANSFEYDPVDPGGEHALNEVPVWRFAPDLWHAESRLDDVIPIQDVIDKLRANKMVASESLAFPQRVYLTQQDIDPKEATSEPGTALILDPGDRESPTNVLELKAAELQNYDAAIQSEINHFFTVSHLPRHLLVGTGADSSGDAIRSDEGPFAEMVHDIAMNFSYTWTDMMAAMLGDESNEWAKPDWRDARVNSNESQAREFKTLVEAGMPPTVAAKQAFGWSMDEASELGLPSTPNGVDNLSDRSQRPDRTQTTEDEPQ